MLRQQRRLSSQHRLMLLKVEESKGEPLQASNPTSPSPSYAWVEDQVMNSLHAFMATNTRKHKLKDSFATFDTNDDGRIDVEEFVAALHSLGLRLDRHAILAVFHSIDDDGGGEITFDELEHHVRSWHRNHAVQREEHLLQLEREMEEQEHLQRYGEPPAPRASTASPGGRRGRRTGGDMSFKSGRLIPYSLPSASRRLRPSTAPPVPAAVGGAAAAAGTSPSSRLHRQHQRPHSRGIPFVRDYLVKGKREPVVLSTIGGRARAFARETGINIMPTVDPVQAAEEARRAELKSTTFKVGSIKKNKASKWVLPAHLERIEPFHVRSLEQRLMEGERAGGSGDSEASSPASRSPSSSATTSPLSTGGKPRALKNLKRLDTFYFANKLEGLHGKIVAKQEQEKKAKLLQLNKKDLRTTLFDSWEGDSVAERNIEDADRRCCDYIFTEILNPDSDGFVASSALVKLCNQGAEAKRAKDHEEDEADVPNLMLDPGRLTANKKKQKKSNIIDNEDERGSVGVGGNSKSSGVAAARGATRIGMRGRSRSPSPDSGGSTAGSGSSGDETSPTRMMVGGGSTKQRKKHKKKKKKARKPSLTKGLAMMVLTKARRETATEAHGGPGPHLLAALDRVGDRLQFLLEPDLWKGTLSAMQTRRMHLLTCDEFHGFVVTVKELIARKDNPKEKLEDELMNVMGMIDPVNGDQMSKHALIEAASNADLLEAIGQHCEYMSPLLPPSIWTQTFMPRYTNHHLDPFLEFDEFRALVMDAVPHLEVAYRKTQEKMKKMEKEAEAKRLAELENMRLASLPSKESEVDYLWSILARRGGAVRIRLPKRDIMHAIKDTSSRAYEYAEESTYLRAFTGKDWVKPFFLMKTVFPAEMNADEFKELCSNFDTSGAVAAPVKQRRKSSVGRTLDDLKEDWLLEQELLRLFGMINKGKQTAPTKMDISNAMIMNPDVTALITNSNRLSCLAKWSGWHSTFMRSPTAKRDRATWVEFSGYFKKFVSKENPNAVASPRSPMMSPTARGKLDVKRKARRKAFDLIDTDGSNSLDTRELLAAVKDEETVHGLLSACPALQPLLEPKTWFSAFMRMPTDLSGNVTFGGFCFFCDAIEASAKREATRQKEKKKARRMSRAVETPKQ